MRMGVPSSTSAGPQMWVRGPTGQETAPAPEVSAPTAPTPPTPPTAPTAQQAPTTGPARPAARTGLPTPPAPAGAPPSQHQGLQVAWVTTHGGAGASTLARVLGGVEVGRRWPDPARGEPSQVLLVARTHNTGIRAASQALNALRTGDHPAGVQLLAVVLVADAPGLLPRALGRRVRVLRSAAEVHRVPWVPAWRLGAEVEQLPRAVRALARRVAAPAGRAGRSR